MPAVYANVVPDALLRAGIRALLSNMVARQDAKSMVEQVAHKLAYVHDLETRGLAEHTRAANEQHYELPPEFFELILGPRRKYSSAYWPPGVTSLSECARVAK